MINKVILTGRLTKDPEMRFSQDQLAIASFAIAVERRFSRQGEERQADFINIVAFGKTAEFMQRFFTKGQLVGIVGRLQVRNYTDKDGNKRYVTEVVAEEAHFCESKRDNAGGNYTSGSDDYIPISGDDESDLPF